MERASAELSKRINGLRGSAGAKHAKGGGSVMERVTNVFCGGGGAAAAVPEKPSRLPARGQPQRQQGRPRPRGHQQQQHATWEQLMHDERFLGRLFGYFGAAERCVLAQVSRGLFRTPTQWGHRSERSELLLLSTLAIVFSIGALDPLFQRTLKEFKEIECFKRDSRTGPVFLKLWRPWGNP